MIKGKINNTVVFLGITEKNVERLKKGDPILIKSQEIKTDFDVVIIYGENMEVCAKQIEEAFGIEIEVPDEFKTL